MHLERIEMTGFKSFADKTVIEFDKGLTAVVGPNGSGKSNLSEAIRWVLGEQSAKSLRGSRMEDVIFNGTQERKPVNLAKVTLVLNNEDRYLDYDFSEISITRSYNRNGDSQYFINKEAVRLKDIVDLLLDSGLGKNSFSIISQGKVEQIFLSKPEERRTIFEEAAGVQKYQYRKVEAERKLVRSTDHLSRVKDIIHELDGQLQPLAKQREAALIYQEKHARLKQLEISLYSYQIEQYRQQWQQAEIDLKNLNQEIQVLDAEQKTLTAAIKKETIELDQLNLQIDDRSELFQENSQQLERLKAKQQVTEQQIQYNQSSLNDKHEAFEQQVARQTQLKAELTASESEQRVLLDKLTEIKQVIKHLEQQRAILVGNDQQQVEQLREQLIDFYQKETTARNQITQYSSTIEQQTERTKHWELQVAELSQNLKKDEADFKTQQKAFLEKQHNQQDLRKQFNQMLEENQLLQQEREKLKQTLFQHERDTQKIDSKVANLKHMQEDYAGYFAGVRTVMKQAQQIGGIEGTVADLIEVPTNLQLAIDTALGGSLQHIVVTNDQAAKAAIQFLKQQHAGRATFLPKTNIKPRYLNFQHLNQAENHIGFVGVANELIKYAEENYAIVANLLGTTIIMDSISNAQQLARKVNHAVKIVTLDGDVLMPGGSITGGQAKKQQNSMLARQNELKQAESQLAQAREILANIEAAWQQNQSKEQQLHQQIEQQREILTQSDMQLQQEQAQVQQLAQTIKQEKNQQIILNDDLQQAVVSLKEAEEKLATARANLITASQAIEDTNQALAQLSLSQEDRQKQLQELDEQYNDLKTELAVKETQATQINQQVVNTKKTLNEITLFIESYEASHNLGVNDLGQLTATLEQTVSDIETLAKQLTTEKETLAQMRERRQILIESSRANDQKERDIIQAAQQSYQQQAKFEAQIEKFEAFIDNQLEYLSEEYQLSYEAATKIAEPIDTATKVNQEVKQLKREIERLGPINLAAIEGYEVLNERYEHLIEQQDDLLKAMSQLKETMDEMDSEVIKRFGETFSVINQQFQTTFRKLFAGGHASLQLTDPNDLLMTGVDIIAQPPGKKKQNLALLSGGERALTAIALLFAILEVKPVPFCILDEVEAALDDANVYRYGEYLQDFTENTQFIVITHRKGTMEHADVLYGVTMERSGISKLASVKLSD